MKKKYTSPIINVKHFARKDVADSNVIVSCSPAEPNICPICGADESINHACYF